MKVLFTKAKLEGWALVAEISGAVAVIVSVIYLGRQINDNTKLLRSQAHYNALSLAQKPLEMMVENESLAGAVTECDANPNGVACHHVGALRQLLFHAVQLLGVHVLPESRRLDPATALGRSRRLLQDTRANEARLRALLE
jgi:hypothetical protein